MPFPYPLSWWEKRDFESLWNSWWWKADFNHEKMHLVTRSHYWRSGLPKTEKKPNAAVTPNKTFLRRKFQVFTHYHHDQSTVVETRSKKSEMTYFNAKIQTFEKGAKIQKLKWDLMKLSKVLRLFLAGKFKSFNETFFEIFKLCVSLSIPILEET